MRESVNGKWTISQDDEHFDEREYFDSKGEAIDFGKRYKEFKGKAFYVGRIETIPMRADCLASEVIEYIQEDHQSNDGEYAEDYLDDVKIEHVAELNKLLEAVVLEWATKHEYHPSYFFVREIETVNVEETV